MITLARNRIVVAVWAALVGATALSWWLGAEHGVRDARLASLLVLLVAFAKVLAVGMYFMELRRAPLPLKLLFGGWCVVAYSALAGMYLFL